MTDRYDVSGNPEGLYQPGSNDTVLFDFEYLVENKNEYIAAIHAGHAGDYEPMKQVFSSILKITEGSS